ncbi:MAG: NYN domain-containing protein [Patescibacteria group bacterium]
MAGPRQKPIYAFIDSQNLNLGVRSQGWKLDFSKFLVYLKDKLKVAKAFLFIGYLKENQKLYRSLAKSGYTLVYKPIAHGEYGKVKGNVDAELVLHTMIEYKNFDQAVIVTGDGDFFCLVEYLNKKGKFKRIIIPNRKKYSQFYVKFKNKALFVNDIKSKVSKQ